MDEPTTAAPAQMQRGLQNRHIRMIGLGSAIGTGLFLVSGSTIHTAGPAVLLAYVVAGAVIFLIMRMLGEMAVARPVSGSFSEYAREHCGPIVGFVAGWNWWMTCIVVSMLELTAVGTFMNFWFPGLPHWMTAAVALVLITGVNLIHVSVFGEFEFWFTLIKVAAVVAMIVFGVAIVFGAGHYDSAALSNLWDSGGFAPHGVTGILLSLVAVTFTFGGIESLGTTAGEAKDPARSIPKAVNGVIVRILVFYVGAIGVMLMIWPWARVGVDGSPFVLMLDGLGVGGAATLLNIVVLVAALSVFNTMVYSNARVLHGMAAKKQAPALLARTNQRGVPVTGIVINSAITGIVVLLNYLFPGQLLMILVAIILSAEIITWSTIAISHLRFRRTAGAGAFRSPLFPYANYLVLAYLAGVVALMTQLPDFRAGAIALPLWLAGLLLAALVYRKIRRSRGHTDTESAETGRPLIDHTPT
ncbi:amino acid permease [Rhodococcus sp. NPDC057014]|uniref:amino acid permease n=1 Tax=Rhodococcus sp. NPDC057014 TaxID=3346000 RepID=UPI0036383D6D